MKRRLPFARLADINGGKLMTAQECQDLIDGLERVPSGTPEWEAAVDSALRALLHDACGRARREEHAAGDGA